MTVIRHSHCVYNVAVNLKTIDLEEMQDWYEYAYSVIRSDCVDESYRCFVHELGHTLGAGHNRELEGRSRALRRLVRLPLF